MSEAGDLIEARTEWLAWRKQGIGASDVAALIGMSKWASPMSMWAEKMGLAPPDEDDEYKEYGRRAEPMIVGYFEDRNPGLTIIDTQARAQHPDHPHHLATLDGRVVEVGGSDPLGVFESKTGGFDEWAEIPDAYACQVQWQMHVDQREHAWFGVMHGRRYRGYNLERDQRAIDILIGIVDAFWTDHVLAEKPPPADAHKATARALGLAYPTPVEGASVPLDSLQVHLDRREEAKRIIKEQQKELEAAENAIKAAIGDAEVGTIGGEPIITWKLTERRGYTVEPGRFRQLRMVGGAR